MTISNLLTKTSALVIISHMAMTSAAFSFPTTENDTLLREDNQPRPVSTQYVDFPVNIPHEIKLEIGDSNSTAHQFYDKKNDGFFTALNVLDSAVKIAITSGGIALGAGLAWFYGPAITFTAAYNLSIWSSTAFVTPNAFTYYMFIKPAATHMALYCANSALIKGAIGMASSGLGYGLGKAGCEAYEGLKYAIGTGAPAAMKYVANTGYSAASTAVGVTGHTLSSAANTTSRLASSAWKWWSGAKTAEADAV